MPREDVLNMLLEQTDRLIERKWNGHDKKSKDRFILSYRFEGQN
jgi:hypothetical protein